MPALDAAQAVWDLRMENDPSARAGIPPHVTLMFPFTPPIRLTDPVLRSLEALIAGTDAFDYSLTRVRQFPQRVVYLEPEPAEPFIHLTRAIGQAFDLLPFGGEFGEVSVPHLTLAMPESGTTPEHVEARLESHLPIKLRAEEAWLMVGSTEWGWRTERVLRLRARPPSESQGRAPA